MHLAGASSSNFSRSAATMDKSIAVASDLASRPLSMLRSIDPSNMVFLHQGQTQDELVHALYIVMYAPTPRSTRIWLLASEFEIILTFLVCTIMLIKKRSLGKLWIITRRQCNSGTFYVSNAVFVLVLGVAFYLVSWDLTAIVIAGFSFARVSSMEWWWIIPLPWWPLVTGAYVSIHGFTIGCSPRSPLSCQVARVTMKHDRKWLYWPLPKSSSLTNGSLIVPCVLFFASTVGLGFMSGRSYYHAKALAGTILPADILGLVHKRAHDKIVPATGENLPVSDELLQAARTVAAAYFESHRFVCINLAVFAACALGLYIPCIVYGVPNLVSLVDHACSCYHEPLPPTCTTFACKVYFLFSKARPRSTQSQGHLDISTWKMTVLAIGYISILVICVPAFAWIPIYIICSTFPSKVYAGDIKGPMTNAILAVSVITILSCTFVACFCTVATLDPLFRAAIGLNMMRTQIPIDITVEHHRSMFEDVQTQSHSLNEKIRDLPAPQGTHQHQGRHVDLERSLTFLKSDEYSAFTASLSNDFMKSSTDATANDFGVSHLRTSAASFT